MEYGFALYKNEWDTVDMTLAIMDTDEEAERKRELLKDLYISTTRRFKLRWGRLNIGKSRKHLLCANPSTTNISFANIFALIHGFRHVELLPLALHDGRGFRNPENEMKFFGQGISFANETKAVEMYNNILQDKLASYATTYENDVAILESKESVSPRLVAATRYRHSKKRILKKHLEILGALKPLVSLLFCAGANRFGSQRCKIFACN